jgi:flagellar biosynthesis chaperone FliJ
VAVSRSLRRLLRIRDLEEEQLRMALESAMGELHTLENALSRANLRERVGRKLVDDSAHTGEFSDRQAGFVEGDAARRHATALAPRIALAEENADEVRQAFLEKRVERRQAETLIETAEALDAVEAARKAQDGLDDWYRSRLYRAALEEDANEKTPVNQASADVRLNRNEL